jgi:AbrB family looped-hinge helix DNA binding protein
MKASIDKVGRLVIPKQVRDEVGLAPGSTVEVSIDGAGIRVESVTGTGFDERDGFLMIPAVGQPITDEDVRELRLADQA